MQTIRRFRILAAVVVLGIAAIAGAATIDSIVTGRIAGYGKATISSPALVGAQSCSSNAVTITGVATGGFCTAILPSTWSSNLTPYCYVSASGTAQLRFCNPTAGGITPPTVTNGYGCSCFW